MNDLLAGFEDFCRVVTIPSRDGGLVPLWPFYGTQEVMLREMRAGLEHDVHEFVILKGGRQIGGSTIWDALALHHPQSHAGMIGQVVSNDDKNRDFRRDVILGMYESLPRSHKWPARMNNRLQFSWMPPNSSRLLFDAAGKREGHSDLGRSRGLNFGYNDEPGLWPDQQAVSALKAAYSKSHPARLYGTIGTAKGDNVFKTMVDTAQRTPSQRFIFLAWWMHAGYRLARGSPLYERYGTTKPTVDERAWIREVKRRYGHELDDEQLAWHRWTLDAECFGDEAMMSQEFGVLPEECFVAFGEKFISAGVIRRLRAALPRAPRGKGYRYEWAEHFDKIEVRSCALSDAELTVYHEPDPGGMYVLAAHPWGSSSPKATAFCCQVWRAWPDRLRLDAEFYATDCLMFRFAWVCVHLAAAYRNFARESKVYFNLEIGWTGAKVLEELRRMEAMKWGFSPGASADFANVFGCIHYLFRRVESFSQQVLPHTKSTPEVRLRNLYGLRDAVERKQTEIPHPALIDELAALRRGEEGDADQVGAGGDASEVRAYVAAMAVDCWLQNAIEDLTLYVAPKDDDEQAPKSVGEALVQSTLHRVYTTGRR